MSLQPGRLHTLLKDLVDCYSPSGKEEDVLEFTRDYIMKQGMVPQLQPVDEDRYNILVLPYAVKDIELCFLGHLDTVVAYDLDEFGFRENGDVISGLGTADMKSGCAAMIEAFTVLTERGGEFPPVALALVVDEEETNIGAETLIRDYAFPAAVIGEPTGLCPCPGHYAYVETMVRTRGRRAHSAVPEHGRNAIEAMLRLLLVITETLSNRDDGLVYNIRDMAGFNSGFVVPDTCEAWLDIHLPPHIDPSGVKTTLRDIIASASGKDETEIELEFPHSYPGYYIPDDDPLVVRLQKAYNELGHPWTPREFRSHSDGSILHAAGIKPVILGPGLLETAHTPEEYVDFSQVVRAAELYVGLADTCR